MAEYACAQRTGDKGEAEACIGGEKLRRRRFGRKEQRPEHQRCGGGIDIAIGRASCRARVGKYVYISVVAVSFKHKHQLISSTSLDQLSCINNQLSHFITS